MFEDLFTPLKLFALSGKSHSVSFRKQNLLKLKHALLKNETRLLEVLKRDLGKPRIEAYVSEIAFVLSEIDFALKNIAGWMKPVRRRTPWLLKPGRSLLCPEPRGAVLIIAPWNYPLQLALVPLVNALAAGNSALLKPSELAPNTARLLVELLHSVFPADLCRVAAGDARAARELLSHPWDHVFFTGSPRTGREVMQAASKHCTPVTLELGGKNPCIVEPDAPLDIAARRIAWGKFMNAGQTCIAPDHVYVRKSVQENFMRELARSIKRFYGPDPSRSTDYARIVNEHHLNRLIASLKDGRIVSGGRSDAAALYLEPTVLTDVDESSPVMQEEIFGPVLPVLPFKDFDSLLDRLRRRPKPLAAYLFTLNARNRERFIRLLSAGTMAINETVTQIIPHGLPFGGTGESGFGSYHGKAGFDCFTHYKTVLIRSFAFDAGVKYPPYRTPLGLLKKIYFRLTR
jgi:acyl-CoA reductase-like NAD-dependent aldehyde dehydrogenase